MSRKEAVKFVAVRSLGNFLLLFSLYGVGATFGPAVWEETLFHVGKARGVEYVIRREEHHGDSRPDKGGQGRVASDPGFSEIIAGNKEQILIPKDTQFSIVIPKIGASTQIFPNVDPTDPKAFLPVLQQGIAHAKGTVFPGMQGNIYLFAHSVDSWWNVGRYNAVFYLLKNLEQGNEIIVFFENRRYDYVVTEKKVANPEDVSLLTGEQKGKERLILQTCWPPGTTWQRLYVVGEPSGK